MAKAGKTIILILMILNGLFFISNIYVLGDTQAAIAMHDDLPRSASALLANAKVIDCFVVGILYLVAAYAIIRKKYNLALAGVVACVLFVGLYIYQLVVWPSVNAWVGFAIFGGLSLLFGGYSWWYRQKRKDHTESSKEDQIIAEISV
jgi:hypothetical protein